MSTITVKVGDRTKTYQSLQDQLDAHLAGTGEVTSLHRLQQDAKTSREDLERWVDLMDGNEGVMYLVRATAGTGTHRILGAGHGSRIPL